MHVEGCGGVVFDFMCGMHFVLRNILMVDLFESRRKYGICVYLARHPMVTSYIQSNVNSLRTHFEQVN